MTRPIYLSQEQYASFVAYLDASRDLYATSRQNGFTLKQKLALQKQAKALRDYAMLIGSPTEGTA